MAGAPASEEFWRGFSRDPRDPAAAALRVSDRDREHLLAALGDAYADGRLDPGEHDERVATAQQVKVFGDVAPVVSDLVPTAELPVRSTPQDLRARAEADWRRELRTAVTGLGGLGTLLIGIWLITSLASGGFYFFWPVFPVGFAALNVAQTLVRREEIIATRERRLAKKEERQRRRLERGDDA